MSTPMTLSDRRSLAGRASLAVFVGVLVSLVGLMVGGSPVSAHTSFLGSTPSDGSSVSEPVSEILVMFTGVSEETGDGFVVQDADGRVREPVVSTFDGKTFRLAFDEPLTDGAVGVRWSVRAGDAHPIDGSFSFTIENDTPTSVVEGTPLPSADEAPSAGADGTSAMSSEEMATMDDFLQVDHSRPGESTATLGRLISTAAIVLAVGALVFAATTLRGRRSEIDMLITTVRVLGAAIVVGAVIEYVGVATVTGDGLTSTWSSSPGVATGLRAVGGIAIALGLAATTTGVEQSRLPKSLSSAANRSATEPLEADFWDERSTEPVVPQRANEPAMRSERRGQLGSGFVDPGLALTHRLANGNSTTRDVARGTTDRDAPSDRRRSTQERAASNIAANHDAHTQRRGEISGSRGEPNSQVRQWIPDRSSSVGVAGAAIAVASFWFDGHTVSKGFRPLHALADSIHVVAGSVWVGGVIAMATVIWLRHERRQPSGALDLVVRFSSVATVALGAVVAAGLVMAVSILDSVGALTSTQWGQTLLLKTAAASIAMLAGAYNHYRLMPALERDPTNAELHHTVRSVVTAEAILLGFVVVVTAWLVAAAS